MIYHVQDKQINSMNLLASPITVQPETDKLNIYFNLS